jgi:hypothetical protein
VGVFGNIDGEGGEDAAVFLAELNADGDQTARLVAVLNEDGDPQVEGTAEVGADVVIRAVEIDDEAIVVQAYPTADVDSGSGEALVITSRYELGRDGLELTEESQDSIAMRSPEEFEFSPEILEPTPAEVTVERSLEARAVSPFMIHGVEGQRLDLSVEGDNDSAVLSIQGLGDESQILLFREYSSEFGADLPATQDYSILVHSVLGSTQTVTINYELAAPPAPTPTPAPLPVPETPTDLSATIPTLFSGTPAVQDSALGNVSSDAAAFIPVRAPLRGIAVVVPGEEAVYLENGDEEMETASVVKVVVMTCVMSRAEQQGRLVSEWELTMMWPMITQSNNDTTDALWSDLGGGPGVAACLNRLGVGGITPYNGPYWGTSTASARGIATLMARLAYGDIVNAEHRAAALAMLVSVIPSQRWGVPAGADSSPDEVVGVKDGWYPDDDGWRVNSVGFISPLSGGEAPYAIAVMTNEQTSQEYGIVTIEGLAEPVWSDLRGAD